MVHFFGVGLTITNKDINKCAELSIYHCFPNHKTAFQLLLITVIINYTELEKKSTNCEEPGPVNMRLPLSACTGPHPLVFWSGSL